MLRASLHGFADGEGASGAIRTVSAAAESVVEEPPAHSPVPPLAERPFWSVMIPIYNCREDYLRETLGSVLRQDPGVADMQIEVLDNCSTIGDPEAVVREMGGGRIAFHRQTHNLGIGGNFNACIERARGHWVHILHGDDTVRPDFYSRARAGVTAHPEVAAALCRIIYMDEDGQWAGLTELESRSPESSTATSPSASSSTSKSSSSAWSCDGRPTRHWEASGPRCRIAWIGTCGSALPLAQSNSLRPRAVGLLPAACRRRQQPADRQRAERQGGATLHRLFLRRAPPRTGGDGEAGSAQGGGLRATRRARLLCKKGMRNAAWHQLVEAVRCSWAPAVVGRSVLCPARHGDALTRGAGRETA